MFKEGIFYIKKTGDTFKVAPVARLLLVEQKRVFCSRTS